MYKQWKREKDWVKEETLQPSDSSVSPQIRDSQRCNWREKSYSIEKAVEMLRRALSLCVRKRGNLTFFWRQWLNQITNPKACIVFFYFFCKVSWLQLWLSFCECCKKEMHIEWVLFAFFVISKNISMTSPSD